MIQRGQTQDSRRAHGISDGHDEQQQSITTLPLSPEEERRNRMIKYTLDHGHPHGVHRCLMLFVQGWWLLVLRARRHRAAVLRRGHRQCARRPAVASVLRPGAIERWPGDATPADPPMTSDPDREAAGDRLRRRPARRPAARAPGAGTEPLAHGLAQPAHPHRATGSRPGWPATSTSTTCVSSSRPGTSRCG